MVQNSLVCQTLNLIIDFIQTLHNVAFVLFSLFGIPAPDIRVLFGSVFGCNL